MSIRGTITFECDQKGCHGECVINTADLEIVQETRGIEVQAYALDWHEDDNGELWCPQCSETNPREKGDDDGVEYGHPRDYRDGRE